MKMKLGLLGLAVWMLAMRPKQNSASTAEASVPESAEVLAKRAKGLYFSSEPRDHIFFSPATPDLAAVSGPR